MIYPKRWRFRSARAGDAVAVAAIHADSWRRQYRGAYADSFLDGDLLDDRETVWTERLRRDDGGSHTVVAEDDAGLVGFGHVVFESHPTWGALLDNLHVRQRRRRQGIGSELLALIARAAVDLETTLHLWVLEQNVHAQAFYEAHGAARIEGADVSPPGGVASRLNGTPRKLRYAWADPTILLAHRLPERQAIAEEPPSASAREGTTTSSSEVSTAF